MQLITDEVIRAVINPMIGILINKGNLNTGTDKHGRQMM